jgi:hypothetical protein
MAKLKAPLLSFDARGKLADTLVFSSWKGIATARQYVVPANPNTTLQAAQRALMIAVVAKIHLVEVQALVPMIQADKDAYNLLGTLSGNPQTWFNVICRDYFNRHAGGLKGAIFTSGITTPGVDKLDVVVDFTTIDGANSITAGTFFYGTSKSNLIQTHAATVAALHLSAELDNCITGLKYFWKFVATAHADYASAVGVDPVQSGIYSGVPT